MRRAHVLVALLLSACGGWGTPGPGSRIPFDSRLGLQVMAGDPLISLRTSAGTMGPSKLLVNAVQGRGRKSDLVTVQAPRNELYEVDFATDAVRKLPDPPLDVGTLATFATTWSNSVTVLRSDADTFALWDGTSWRTLPTPPGTPASDRPMLVVDERHVLLERGDSLVAFDGTSWVSAPRKGQLGPVGETGVRVLFFDGRGLCTELLSWSSLQPQGPAICTANADLDPQSPALNGTVDDFQAIVDGALFHFRGGSWQRGVPVPSTSALVTLPGSTSVPLRQQLTALFPSHLVAKAGAVTGLLTPQLTVKLDCSCNRATDPACGCAVPDMPQPEWVFLNDGSGLVSITLPTLDARRAVFARKLELPLSDSPWGPVCSKACGAGERCEVQVGLQGFVSEVCASNDPRSSVPRARLEATVRPANPGVVTITLANPDGGALDAQVIGAPPALVIEGPPLAPVQVTLAQEGHAPRVLELRFPDASRTGNLGNVPLVGAQYLATEPGAAQVSSAPITSAGALLVTHVEADAGSSWVAVRASADGGLTRSTLAPGRVNGPPPLWLPRQHRVLIEGPAALLAFDDVTLEPRGSLAGVNLDLEPVATSESDVALLAGSSTRLVRFDAQAMTVLATWAGEATRLLLAADGGVGVRATGGSWQALFADGSTRSLPGLSALSNPTLEATGRAVFVQRNNQLVEIALSTGAERVLFPEVTTVAAGTRTDRVVASGSIQDGGVFVPFTDLYASGTRQGPFTDGLFMRTAPCGGWLSIENGDLVLRTIDDGVIRDTLAGFDWRIVPLTDEGFAALPADQSRATEVRYFVDGVRVATLAKSTLGAPFGATDSRLISARRLYRYEPAAGTVSDERFVIDDVTPFTLEPAFLGLAAAPAFASRPIPSSRGMPCALFTTPHVEWSVAGDGTVTRAERGVDLFCAP